jgi:hypothetical protein
MTLPEPHRRLLCRSCKRNGEEPAPSVLRNPGQRRSISAQSLVREYLRWLPVGVAATILLGFSLPAWASLGGASSSVEADSARMNATRQVTQNNSYAIHQITAPQGTVVNEYVSPEGKVFAVSWHGQFPPQMQQILGTYFEQYVAALKAQLNQAQPRAYGHQPLNLQLPGLVVQTSGQMGAYSGRAYIPEMLPQGTLVGQIQ